MLTISPEARIYALRELVLRAGVNLELFERWQIELTPGYSRLWIDEKRFVQFPNAGLDFWREIVSGEVRVANLDWSRPVYEDRSNPLPKLIVPFAERDVSGPLFFITDQVYAECAVDLLSSIWLTLSRFEETLPGTRDSHGRFTAQQSLAFRNGYLRRPIVDEYGLAFEQILKILLPRWTPLKRELRVKLSHDIDLVGVPFHWKSSLGHALSRHNATAAFRDLLATVTTFRPAYLQCVVDIAETARVYGLRSAVYWKANPPGPFDSAYELRSLKLAQTLSELRSLDVEMGIHPGYYTFLAPEKLIAEVEKLRCVLGDQELGGRQHFLRWSPATWLHWEMAGLGYDSSVGFADQIGFRAGTSFPYRPWLLDLNREADLLEIPLLVMDATLTSYLNLAYEDSLATVRDVIACCKKVGGVFAFLWHNDSLVQRKSRMLYQQILLELSGVKTYDWKSGLQIFRQQGVRQQRTRESVSAVAL